MSYRHQLAQAFDEVRHALYAADSSQLTEAAMTFSSLLANDPWQGQADMATKTGYDAYAAEAQALQLAYSTINSGPLAQLIDVLSRPGFSGYRDEKTYVDSLVAVMESIEIDADRQFNQFRRDYAELHGLQLR